jgi:hypothetical protein
MSLNSWDSNDIDSTSSSDLHMPITPPLDFSYSQQDVLQELNKSVIPDNVASNHQYQLSYELAVDNSPLSPSNYTHGAAHQVHSTVRAHQVNHYYKIDGWADG